MSSVKTSLGHKRIRRLIWLVFTVFVLLGYSLQSVAGNVHYSMVMQAYATVGSPPVILEEGTAGSSTIYTSNTSAKVSVAAPIWLSGWDKRLRITIDHNDVDSGLSNFSVLVYLSNSSGRNNDDVSFVFDEVGSNSKKIAVTTSDRTTQCYVEIERWDNATEQAWLWVKIPNISNTTDTTLYLYYDKDKADNVVYVDDTASGNSTKVWDSNFKAVLHLNQTPSGLADEIKDSTSYANHGTTEGSMNSTDLVDAKIGSGLEFDEIDDLISIPNSTSLSFNKSSGTCELWINWANASDGDHQIVMSSSNRFTAGAKDGFEWASQGSGNHFFYPWGGDDSNYNLGPNPFTNGIWHHLVVTYLYATKEVKIYVDAVNMSFTTENVPTFWTQLANTSDWLWGGNPDRSTRYFDGFFDEIRIHSESRNMAWIKASYESGSDDLLDFGLEENWLSGWNKRIKITIDNNDVDSALSSFPVLVYLSNSSGRNNDDVSFVFDELQSDANRKKIAVTTSDGLTQCYVEIETWDHTNEKAWLWVKVPSVNSTADTDLYLYYDSSQPDNTAYVGDVGSTSAENVWDTNFKGVWHLKDLTTSTVEDSTSNNNDGTKGAADQPIEVDAKVGKGQDFTPTAQYIEVGTTGFSSSSGTVEAWGKAEGFSGTEANYLFGHTAQPPWTNRTQLYTDDVNGNLDLGLGDSHTRHTNIQDLDPNTWYHVVLTWNGTNYVVYVDSVTKANGTYSGLTSIYSLADIGNTGNPAARVEAWNGTIDEVRVSDVPRSVAWIKANYESGRDDLVDFASGESTCSFYSGWNYRKKITIDHTEVEGSTDFTNFPVLISLPSDAGLANHARDNGWDILFTSSDGKTKLSHEIEKFDGNTGELVAWVKAPTLYATSGTVLYVYYGNPSATNQENVTNVWSNGYVAVWHLNDDFVDSTSNNHDGTNYGSTDVAGNMARGREFNPDDGSADRIEFGTWSVSGSQITIQTWAKFDDFNQDDPRVVTKAQSGAEQDHVFMLSLTNGGSGDNRMRMRLKTGTSDSSGTTTLIAGSSGDMTANTWYLLATTYDGSYMRLMKNGDVVGSTTKNGDLRENSWEIWAGNNPGGSTTMFSMDGKLDEIRISNVTRSTAWLKTEYNNQYNPSNFYSMGSEEENTSTTYDYVLEVVNQVADNWQVNLQVYDSSNIGRLSSLNISLHDGTSSNQIAVSGGNITQPEGPPYNLTSNMTTYISISDLQATSSGTSYLYVYLKILVPSTSTYNLFIITLEIT